MTQKNQLNSQSTLENIRRPQKLNVSSLIVESVDCLNTVKQCRICLENQQQSFPLPLIRPCKCAGSVSYVHEKCLHQWIQTHCTRNSITIKHNTIQCQLCKHPIKFESEQLNQCASCEQVRTNIIEKIVLFCLIVVLFAFSITGTTISLYVISEQVKLLARGNGFFFVVILSVCGAVFSVLFFVASVFLFISEYLLKKVIRIGKVRQHHQRIRRNKVVPTHEPVQNQSIQQISYAQ